MALVAWLSSVVAAGAAASGGSACTGRPLLAADGAPSDLTDCALDAQLERAGLREQLADCVDEASRAEERVYGKLKFSLGLHAGGGVTRVHVERSAFRRTCLPDCLARTIRRRLGGKRLGRPAALAGQVTLAPGHEVDFGLSLSGMLAPAPRPAPPPLPGRFSRDPDGSWSSCGLGRGQLFLRLDPHGAAARSAAEATPELAEPVQACLDLAQAEANGSKHRRKRLSARARKRLVTGCLADLLEGSTWEVKAQAAEELARSWRWRGRRAIQRAVEAGLRDPTCDPGAPPASGQPGKAAKAGDDAEQSEACAFAPPAAAEAGHALVRMLKAQLRLRRSPKDGILDALAAHPDGRVRLRLVDSVLSRWRSGVPEGIERLVRDPDPLVRARAQQVGCLRDDWGALGAFRADLESEDPALLAQTLIHARACADRSVAQVTAAARRESSPILALVMLRAVPVQDPELVLRRAGPGLFDPCPLARYLSARLLGRLAEPPAELARRALAREPDPLIKRLLTGLASPGGAAGPPPVEQLWMQAAAGSPAGREP